MLNLVKEFHLKHALSRFLSNIEQISKWKEFYASLELKLNLLRAFHYFIFFFSYYCVLHFQSLRSNWSHVLVRQRGCQRINYVDLIPELIIRIILSRKVWIGARVNCLKNERIFKAVVPRDNIFSNPRKSIFPKVQKLLFEVNVQMPFIRPMMTNHDWV